MQTETDNLVEYEWYCLAKHIEEQAGQQEVSRNEMNVCQGCKNTSLTMSSHEIVCFECGLVQADYISNVQTNVPFETQDIPYRRACSAGNSKMKKMQEWYMWTNEEKNEYKLVNYTKTLCTKLEINEGLTSSICSTVVEVMNVIKKYDGTKRARVKDGIILTCIQYVSKDGVHKGASYISAVDLARKINLEIKYVTRAEKIMLELLANKKLKLDKRNMLETQHPYEYVLTVVQKKSLKIPPLILLQVRKLINICEGNDILLDHTPLSIGVCCFYYVLKANGIELDVKLFSDLYDLSVVTVIKTYNKLKQYENQITEWLRIE